MLVYLLLSISFSFDIYQKTHQYVLQNQDVTIHYTQLTVEPFDIIFITPTKLIIKDEIVLVSNLTANKLGEIYLRYPILDDNDIYLEVITIKYKNGTKQLHLDTAAHFALYENKNKAQHGSEEYKLAQVAGYTYNIKAGESIPIDIEDFPSIEASSISDKIKGLWDWIKKLFQSLSKSILNLIKQIRQAFDFGTLINNRKILWHYLNLVFDFSLRQIKNITFTQDLQFDFNTTLVDHSDHINTITTSSSRNVLLGTFVENIDRVHSQSAADLIKAHDSFTIKLKDVVANKQLQAHLSTAEFSVLDQFNNVKGDLSQLVSSVLGIVKIVWKLVKKITGALFNLITSILRPFADFLAKIQYSIIELPLIIPGVSSWLGNRLNDQLRIIDFFLIPAAAKINLYFDKYTIKFSDEDVNMIVSIKKFEKLQFLDKPVLLKLHWAERLLVSFGFTYQIPFSVIKSIPVVNWLNPLWNSPSFIIAMLSAPHQLFKPTFSVPDIRLHVARLFNSFLSFIPNPLVLYPNVVGQFLQLTVYKVPFTVFRFQKIDRRTIESLPQKYKQKKLMLGLHTSVDLLRISSQFLTLSVLSQPFNFAALAATTAISDLIISYGIQWNTSLAF
eukprot:NODE_160_length_15021_cov_0.894786.p2 type:complete len:615 gc:universal NODE_160_length_15021_cov_0.894786:3683-1839(-)